MAERKPIEPIVIITWIMIFMLGVVLYSFGWLAYQIYLEDNATIDCKAECSPKKMDFLLDSKYNCICVPRDSECKD